MNKRTLLHILTTLPLVTLSSQSLALQIILNDVGGADPNSQAGIAFRAASQFWESNFSDNIAVHLDVGFTSLGSNILGQARSFSQSTSYADIRNAIIQDITTNTDQVAATHLPISEALSFLSNDPNGNIFLDDNGSKNNSFLNVNRANLKALGLAQPSSLPDAEITFSSDFGFDFDQSDGVASHLFDFIGIATHEIGHALGFVSGVDFLDYYSGDGPGNGILTSFDNRSIYSVLDLFRFSDRSLDQGPSTRDLAFKDATQYFSIDDGLTNTALFSTGSYNGDGKQASHWKNISDIGILKPTISRGSIGSFTENDFLAFDVIGYDRIETTSEPEPVPVPLPSNLLLMLVGILSINYARKII